VIADLKPYAAYKDSGLPWLGNAPAHWDTRRMKFLFTERVQKGFPDEPLLAATQSKGVVRKEEYGSRTVMAMKDLHLLKLVETGDFVISLRSFEGGLEVARCRGIISPAYTVLEPRGEAGPGYYAQLFKSPAFISSLTLFVTGKAKVFCRTYDFLASVMPGTNPEWEKLSMLLNLLVSKLPAPKEEDLAKGILQAIDMDSYRVEKKALMKIALADADAEIAPVPTDGGGRKREPELDRLSNILKTFNDNFGTLFADTDRVAKRIRDDIAPKVAADKAFQNARDNTPHTARMAHDQALGKVMQILLKDDTQVYKQFVENESFRRFVGDMAYQLTTQRVAQ